MSRSDLVRQIESALAELEPTEVRVHFEDDDVALVLVLSDQFKDVGMFKRITRCIDLIDAHSEVLSELTTLVEPVTPSEFKDRLVPWPE